VTVLAAALIALAVFTVIPGRPDPRLRRLMVSAEVHRPSIRPKYVERGAVVLAGIGCLSIFGVMPGVPLALLSAVIVIKILGRLESAESRHQRMLLERQLPDALDVLTSVLEAGASTDQALARVGHSLGPPIGLELDKVVRALSLGASGEQAWELSHPVMKPLAAAMIRSATSGAPLALVLAGASRDVRREHHVRVEVAARSAGVRAVAPLAACFLPAFFLIGVAPIIAAFVDQLLHS